MPTSKSTRKHGRRPRRQKPGRDEADATRARRLADDFRMELLGQGLFDGGGYCRLCDSHIEHKPNCSGPLLTDWAEARGIR